MKNAKSIAFTKNEGLTVEEITRLRKELRTVNTSFTLAKKTLIKLALKEVYGAEIDDNLLPGQIAVVCSNNDAVEGLGKLNSLSKEILNKKDPKIVFVSSYFDGAIRDAKDTKTIASLPSKETLLGRLVGSMMSPLSSLARFLDAAKTELENTGKSKVGELEGSSKSEEVISVKEEAKVEELKEEPASFNTEVPEEIVSTENVEQVEENSETPSEESKEA